MRKTVLVVDDSPLVSEAIRSILSEQGYEVVGALDRPAALATCGAAHIDAILVDLQLRRESGLVLLAHIREHMPGIKRILMSGAIEPGGPMPSEVVTVADAALSKPFEPRELQEILSRLLE